MHALAPPRARRDRSAAGFTLVEISWAMMVFFIVAATAIVSLRGWIEGERFRGTTSEIEALLRQTQQQAVTEGRTLCVDFDLAGQSYSVYRGECGDTGLVLLDGPIEPASGVTLDTASFAGPSGDLSGVSFYPRGTATPGSTTITGAGSDRVDTLVVEGLTGRVSRG